MARGVKIHMDVGQRFTRWTALEVGATDALCLCDCGTVKVVTKSNLHRRQSRSCGCLRVEVSTEKALRESGPNANRGWSEGWWDRAKIGELGRLNATMQRGVEAPGKNAKGVDHHAAKWYSVASPMGQIIEGNNLNQLVRDNIDMFEKSDVVWKRNRWGTETDCAAMRGLRSIFARPKGRKPAGSWKGWTAIGRDEKIR